MAGLLPSLEHQVARVRIQSGRVSEKVWLTQGCDVLWLQTTDRMNIMHGRSSLVSNPLHSGAFSPPMRQGHLCSYRARTRLGTTPLFSPSCTWSPQSSRNIGDSHACFISPVS